MSYKFNVGDKAVLNTKATDLNKLNGTLVEIIDNLSESNNNDYRVEYINKLNKTEVLKVQEKELQEIKDDRILQLEYGQDVTYTPTGETAKVEQINLLYGQVGIRFLSDNGFTVVGLESLRLIEKGNETMDELQYKIGDIDMETDDKESGYFAELGLSIGRLVDKKQKAYGDSVTKCYEIMKILLKDYKNDDNTYTIPESLLPQMLLDVRKIDKMNRRFSNPDGDLMGENPFQDDVGYSMLGVRMIEQQSVK